MSVAVVGVWVGACLALVGAFVARSRLRRREAQRLADGLRSVRELCEQGRLDEALTDLTALGAPVERVAELASTLAEAEHEAAARLLLGRARARSRGPRCPLRGAARPGRPR